MRRGLPSSCTMGSESRRETVPRTLPAAAPAIWAAPWTTRARAAGPSRGLDLSEVARHLDGGDRVEGDQPGGDHERQHRRRAELRRAPRQQHGRREPAREVGVGDPVDHERRRSAGQQRAQQGVGPQRPRPLQPDPEHQDRHPRDPAAGGAPADARRWSPARARASSGGPRR